jgi:hypothetical protein
MDTETAYSLISREMLKKAEEQKEKFVVVGFDLPCENIDLPENDGNKKLKGLLATHRVGVGNYFYSNGVRLNKSVYILRVDRVDKCLIEIEKRYVEIPQKYSKKVNVKIVGTVFKDVIQDLLIKDIAGLLKNIREDLELLDVDVSNRREPNWSDERAKNSYAKLSEKLMKRAYKISRKERIVENRCEDLNELNEDISKKKKEELEKMMKTRDGIMEKI